MFRSVFKCHRLFISDIIKQHVENATAIPYATTIGRCFFDNSSLEFIWMQEYLYFRLLAPVVVQANRRDKFTVLGFFVVAIWDGDVDRIVYYTVGCDQSWNFAIMAYQAAMNFFADVLPNKWLHFIGGQ